MAVERLDTITGKLGPAEDPVERFDNAEMRDMLAKFSEHTRPVFMFLIGENEQIGVFSRPSDFSPEQSVHIKKVVHQAIDMLCTEMEKRYAARRRDF